MRTHRLKSSALMLFGLLSVGSASAQTAPANAKLEALIRAAEGGGRGCCVLVAAQSDQSAFHAGIHCESTE